MVLPWPNKLNQSINQSLAIHLSHRNGAENISVSLCFFRVIHPVSDYTDSLALFLRVKHGVQANARGTIFHEADREALCFSSLANIGSVQLCCCGPTAYTTNRFHTTQTVQARKSRRRKEKGRVRVCAMVYPLCSRPSRCPWYFQSRRDENKRERLL